MSKCRTCKAPILWVTMESGKKNPLDPKAVKGGNIQTLLDRETGETTAWVVTADAAVYAHVSHFTTCPDAGLFKGKS